MRNVLLIFGFLIICGSGRSETMKPIKWVFEAKRTAVNEYDLIFHAKIQKTWHLYSQFLDREDGPVKTSFTFNAPDGFTRHEEVKELSKIISEYDKNFDMKLKYFETEAVFIQHIKLTKDIHSVTGTINFMSCNDRMCLPPEDVDFSFVVKYENGKN